MLIVGAGPAGATAATLLARAGRRVLLIDREAFPRDKACGDLIGSIAIATLRRLEIDLDAVRSAAPLRGAFVYDPCGRRLGAELSLRNAERHGARVIPRKTFDASLVNAALQAGAMMLTAQATAVIRTPTGAVGGVRLSDGSLLRAALTIGADGWSSIVSRAMFGTPRAPDGAGIAIRSYVADAATDTAMRFHVGAAGDGYGWIFPLGDGAANVGLGFVRNEPGADNLTAAYARFLNRPEFKTAQEVGPRRAWPIPFGPRGTPVSAAGALLVGDAASLASALSGSGIHTAIASGALAAGVADEALDRDDVSASALRNYDRRLGTIWTRLRLERWIHGVAGTPAGSARAIGACNRIPGVGRLAVGWFLNLG